MDHMRRVASEWSDERLAAAALEATVPHHTEALRPRVHLGVAEPLIVVPVEAALIECHSASEEHRELPADN